jgi:type VI secretion system protein ImpG
MDPRLLRHYNQELAHLREMGAEFSKEFPKIAARLGMEGMEVADPYVERLLEGFAFVAARIQLKLEAEFPRFSQHMLEMIYPHFLAPMPSMAMCCIKPNFADTALTAGVEVPRSTALHSIIPRGEQTACEFRTAHALTLWPIELTEARYVSFAPDLPLDRLAPAGPVKGALRLRLRCHAGLKFKQLALDKLDFHINAEENLAVQLMELIHGNCVGGAVSSSTGAAGKTREFARLDKSQVLELGFDDSEAILPFDRRSFQGYRLLQEYFAFPARFLFFRLNGLAKGLSRIDADECELVLFFGRGEPALESLIDAQNIVLYATPVVNLFPKRADRIHLSEERFEHHLAIDRARPMDFEVFAVTGVKGLGVDHASEVGFQPFYAGFDEEDKQVKRAYYTLRREPRMLSHKQKQHGPRTGYIGSEAFLSLVDERESPYSVELRQLAVEVLATNRDLPLLLPIGSMNSLMFQNALPVEGITLLKGPTRPRNAMVDGDYAWALINHLSLNYLSLFETQGGSGVQALRELLQLYSDSSDPIARKQIEAVWKVAASPIVARMPVRGPIVFGRGLNIELTVDESGFAGAGAYLLGAVLEKFFARHVSLNSFTRTTLRSESRGRIAQWPARTGVRIIG